MHPALVAAIVVGGAVVLYGGYEVVSRMYEEYEERRQYESFVRQYGDYEKLDDDGEDDQRTATTGRHPWHRRNEQLRQRKTMSASRSQESMLRSSIELDALEKSIEERQRRLMQEQETLDQAERELEHRREVLAQSESSLQQNDVTTAPLARSFGMSSGSFASPSSSSSSSSASSVASDHMRPPSASATRRQQRSPPEQRSDGYRSSASDGFASVSESEHPHTSDSYDILSDDDYRSP